MTAMDKKKMLAFVTDAITRGGVGDTRVAKGLLVLQLKYFYENSDVSFEAVRETLESLDDDGEICLFALPENHMDNVVVQLPTR